MNNFLNKLFSRPKYFLPLGDQIRLVAPFSGESDIFEKSVFIFEVEQLKFIVLDGTIFHESNLAGRDGLIRSSLDSYRIRLMDLNSQIKIDYYPCLWDRFSLGFLRLRRGRWRVQLANNDKQDLLAPVCLDISANNLEDFPEQVRSIVATVVDQFWRSYQDAYCKFVNKKAQKFNLKAGSIDFINQLGDATNLVAPDQISRFLATCVHKSRDGVVKN